jgi:hypothetical protein
MVTYDQSAELPRSGAFRAVVRAGESVTAYLRTGNGKPVVLLRAADHPVRLWEQTLAQLSLGFRVIVPELAPDPATLSEWFAAFHDGLGIGAVCLVVDDSYAAAAIALTLGHGSRIERLVFVSRGAEADQQIGTIADHLSRELHPLLVIAGSDPVDAVVERVAEFLRGG